MYKGKFYPDRRLTATLFHKGHDPEEEDSESDYVPGEHIPEDFFDSPEESVLFYACKAELFTLKNNYKQFGRKLRQHLGFGVIELKEELGEGLLEFSKLVVIAGIQKPLVNKEKRLLTEFLMKGGSILMMAEGNCKTDYYNEFLAPFGIELVNDMVINTKRVLQYLPKQCVIENFVSTPSILPVDKDTNKPTNFDVMYPLGCTLNICKTAFPLASSGLLGYPPQRPVAAIYVEPISKGKLFVFGSGHLFADGYFDKQENSKFLEFVMDLLCGDPGESLFHISDSTDLDIVLESTAPPQTLGFKSSSQRAGPIDAIEHMFPKSLDMLGRSEPASGFESSIEKHHKPELKQRRVGKKVNVVVDKKLSNLVKPAFVAPFPPVKLALHPPFFRDLPGPPLELFDLDEEFSTPTQRLETLKNKCTDEDEDLEYYIESMGKILGIDVPDTKPNPRNPDYKNKAILHQLLANLANVKLAGKGGVDSGGSGEVPNVEEK